MNDRVLVDHLIMGGVPCIRGTRIPVATVLGLMSEGVSTAEILEYYPQTPNCGHSRLFGVRCRRCRRKTFPTETSCIKFLVDECLSSTVTAALNTAGHDAVHVTPVGLQGHSDPSVMEFARAQGQAAGCTCIAQLIKRRGRFDRRSVWLSSQNPQCEYDRYRSEVSSRNRAHSPGRDARHEATAGVTIERLRAAPSTFCGESPTTVETNCPSMAPRHTRGFTGELGTLGDDPTSTVARLAQNRSRQATARNRVG